MYEETLQQISMFLLLFPYFNDIKIQFNAKDTTTTSKIYMKVDDDGMIMMVEF